MTDHRAQSPIPVGRGGAARRPPLLLLALVWALALAASPPPARAQGAPELKRIAVFDVRYTSADRQSGERMGRALTDMLTTGLSKTGKFVVIERDRLDQVTRESTEIPDKHFMDDSTVAKIGKLVGATHYLIGNLTEFHYGVGKKNLDLLQVIQYSASARLGADLRLVNTETGVVEFADSIRKDWGNTWQTADQSRGPGGAADENRTFENLARQLADDAAQRIVKAVYPVRVMKVDGTTVFLNRGSAQGMKTGFGCDVQRQGEALVDPDTGAVLGNTARKIGRVKVFEVSEKFSQAKVVDSTVPIATGDTCK